MSKVATLTRQKTAVAESSNLKSPTLSPSIACGNSSAISYPSFDRYFFLQELVRQIRILDTLGTYETCSNEVLLQSLIQWPTAECQSDRAISPHPQLHLTAFYHAIAAAVAAVTGKVTQVFLNLSNLELSSALIFCDRLLVISEFVRNANCFGFESIENLCDRAEELVRAAMLKADRYFD